VSGPPGGAPIRNAFKILTPNLWYQLLRARQSQWLNSSRISNYVAALKQFHANGGLAYFFYS
jgi:hypothetical protein